MQKYASGSGFKMKRRFANGLAVKWYICPQSKFGLTPMKDAASSGAVVRQEYSTEVERLRQQFAQYLQEHRYRNTQERMRILERITELSGHFTADELYVYMRTMGDRISRATVYSTLELLVRCDILVRHRFESGGTRFELASRLPNHDHLVCTDCGRIVEFYSPGLMELAQHIAQEHQLRAVRHSLQIFARCPSYGNCPHQYGQ